MKNQTVRRVLQDNKVLGTSAGTREAEASGPEPTGSAAIFLGERPGASLDLNRRNFSKRKRENRGIQQLFREFSTAVASCAPNPWTVNAG